MGGTGPQWIPAKESDVPHSLDIIGIYSGYDISSAYLLHCWHNRLPACSLANGTLQRRQVRRAGRCTRAICGSASGFRGLIVGFLRLRGAGAVAGQSIARAGSGLVMYLPPIDTGRGAGRWWVAPAVPMTAQPSLPQCQPQPACRQQRHQRHVGPRLPRHKTAAFAAGRCADWRAWQPRHLTVSLLGTCAAVAPLVRH